MAPPMPPIPAIVAMPNDRSDGYYIATVIAAIPLSRHLYAVVGIYPTSSPCAPRFFAATASQSIHGTWTVDDMGGLPTDDSLADSIHSMLAIRAHDAWPGMRTS